MIASLLPQRAPVGLLFLLPSWAPFTPTVFRRHQSSYQRTRKRLNVKPHPSFFPSKTQTEDHIIFNPPASTPSVYHTPTKFLPEHDRRRQLFATANSPDQGSLAPPVRPPCEKKYHLTEKDLEEMRKLRKEDPMVWTRTALAKKFECSSLFVGMACQAEPKMKELRKKVEDAVRSNWSPKRQIAREDRARRRAIWGRDG